MPSLDCLLACLLTRFDFAVAWLYQVDNPCAVLDQENSKKFLQGSATDKYNFFMRANDLSRITEVRSCMCSATPFPFFVPLGVREL